MARPVTRKPKKGLVKLCSTSPVVLLSFVMVTLVFFGTGPAAGRLGRVAIVRNRLRAHISTCQGSRSTRSKC